jgi:hypothetical protein
MLKKIAIILVSIGLSYSCAAENLYRVSSGVSFDANTSGTVPEHEMLFETSDNDARSIPSIGTGFNYTVEMKIPEDQQIFGTVQGNFGLNTSNGFSSVHVSIYRDGTSMDGFIYEDTSGARYKHLIESGDTIKWVFSEVDVTIFVNEVLTVTVADAVNLSVFTNIGAAKYNPLTTDDSGGRRPIEYIRVYRD